MKHIAQQPQPHNCPHCGARMVSMAHYCPQCGVAQQPHHAEEIFLSGGKFLRMTKDSFDITDLRAIVETGITWWEQQQAHTKGVDRLEAVAAVQELSRILESVSQQIVQGRRNIRITTRLPAQRAHTVACGVCGHGNRPTARFCHACGMPIVPTSHAINAVAIDAIRDVTPHAFDIHLTARSDRGMVRQHNEDAWYAGMLPCAAGDVALLIVADGMGGAQAGEEASRLACDGVQQRMQDELSRHMPHTHTEWHHMLQRIVVDVNSSIYAQAHQSATLYGMGTTLTVVVIAHAYAHLAHVGDSRAYIINAHGVLDEQSPIVQLTTDHTLVARLVDIGHLTTEEARTSPQRHILYRALGADATVAVDTASHMLTAGDSIVLCSDGLTGYITNDELATTVCSTLSRDAVCERLVTLANNRGGHDNISVVVATINHHPTSKQHALVAKQER